MCAVLSGIVPSPGQLTQQGGGQGDDGNQEAVCISVADESLKEHKLT